MRVCICTDTLVDLNGVARFIRDMGSHALRNGFDLHIVTSTKKQCPDAPYIHNIPPRLTLPMPAYNELSLNFVSSKSLERTLLELRPDILHISTPGPVGSAARKIAIRHGFPIAGTYHTDFSACVWEHTRSHLFKGYADRFMSRFHEGFRHVFTRSDVYIPIMCEDIGIDEEKITLIKPGTDLQTFNPSHRNAAFFDGYGTPRHAIKVLYVGRVTKEKNILFLIEVWKEFRRRNPGIVCELFLAGEGYHRKLQPRLHEFGIRFLGPVVDRELSELYASSDLFLFPSVFDTLGQVVMEAQASGLAVVVSDVGGPQTIVNFNGRRSGIVARGNDLEAWVQAVEMMMKNATLRRQFGAQGHENMKYFNIEHSFRDFALAHHRLYDACAAD